MRILVPVDGSENSMHAVEFIASRTTLLGSNPEIEVLNVQLPLPARACRLVGQDSLTRYYEDEAAKVFEPVRAELNKVGFQAGEAFLVGEASDSIAAEAEKFGADLIVMGSRGQTALRGLFFGSVSNGVLAKSKCPVLMLRDKAAPQSDALKVGIAVDGSKHYGCAAVRYALKHISLFGTGAQFYLINVVSDYAGAVMPDMAGMALPALSEEEVLRTARRTSSMKPLSRCVRSSPRPPSRPRKSASSATQATKSPPSRRRRSSTSWSWAPTATAASRPPSWARPQPASPPRATFRF